MFEIGQAEIDAVADTIRRGILTRFQGGTEGYLARSERAIAEKIGTKHALMLNSGTIALISALVALGIGKGDEVLVSAYTWISTPLAPMLLQAVPKLVEIDESLTMDPEDLEPEAFMTEPLDLTKRLFKNKTVVVGHLPTTEENGGNGRIWFGNGGVNINCGVKDGGYLGCLRLDDMKEYYI